jgi:hypothetical protein
MMPACDIPALFANDALTASGCAGLGCHGPASSPPDLVSEGLVARLKATTPTYCPSDLYIDAANIRNSLLYTKTAGSPTCGTPMPSGRPPLDAATLACLEQWLTEVAAQP